MIWNTIILIYALNDFKVIYSKILQVIIDLNINIFSIIKFQELVARHPYLYKVFLIS